MLIDSIIHAQQGCDSDMMFLVSKFSGILKKYARKLNYEDAEQDLTADFIELIHHIDSNFAPCFGVKISPKPV